MSLSSSPESLALQVTTGDLARLDLREHDSLRVAIDDFFAGMLGNPHTRIAYLRAVRHFFGWCDEQGITLSRVTAGQIGRYFDAQSWSPPTVNQHLAALRRLFDHLVTMQHLPTNPASPVRRGRYSQDEGRTAEITLEQVRQLLASIDTNKRVGLRDRTILGVLNFTGARVGAIGTLRRGDLVFDGSEYTLRFREKNGKRRVVPVHHELKVWLVAYLDAFGLAGVGSEELTRPLFRCVRRAAGVVTPTDRGLDGEFIRRMVKRRCRDAGLPGTLTPHSFRVKTVTCLLSSGVPLEDVQYLVGHADPRTTRLYDRRKQAVTRSVIERIET